jgi:hypothetical protein
MKFWENSEIKNLSFTRCATFDFLYTTTIEQDRQDEQDKRKTIFSCFPTSCSSCQRSESCYNSVVYGESKVAHCVKLRLEAPFHAQIDFLVDELLADLSAVLEGEGEVIADVGSEADARSKSVRDAMITPDAK